MKPIKKKTAILTAFLVCGLFSVGLASCGAEKTELPAPQNLRMEDEILRWDETEGAEGYRVSLNGADYLTDEPFLDTFELLAVPGEYSMSVTALGNAENTVESLPSAAFTYTIPLPSIVYKKATSLINGSEYVIVQADPENPPEGKLILPDVLDGLPVTTLSTEGFGNCTKITSVLFPGRLTSFSSPAFAGCTELKRVKLPEGLETIFGGAFQNCTALWDCTIPNTVKTVEYMAFAGCTALRELKLPASVNRIMPSAWQATRLERVEVDEGNETFYSEGNCVITRAEKEIVVGCPDSRVPDGAVSVGEFCFYGMGLTQLPELPESVTALRAHAFAENDITSFTLPKHITDLSYSVFSGCKIDSMFAEEGNPAYYAEGNCILTREGKTVVMGCANSSIPADAEAIGEGAFTNCTNLTELAVPRSVKTIGDSCFYNCSRLKTVFLADGLQKIGEEAFTGCLTMESLTIPKSVKEIARTTFRECSATLYTHINYPASAFPDGWAAKWNAGHTLVYGCDLAYEEDGTCYVRSIAPFFKGSLFSSAVLIAPKRAGYLFAGWATEPDGEVAFPAEKTTRVVSSKNFPEQIMEALETRFKEDPFSSYWGELEGVTLYGVWIKE